MKKKVFSIIVTLLLLVVVTGCGKAKTIKCSYENGESMSRELNCEFKNGKATKCSLTKKFEFSDEKTANEYIEGVKNNDETAKVTIDGRKTTVVYYKVEEADGKSYDEIRKTFKKGGFICK